MLAAMIVLLFGFILLAASSKFRSTDTNLLLLSVVPHPLWRFGHSRDLVGLIDYAVCLYLLESPFALANDLRAQILQPRMTAACFATFLE